MFVNSCNEELQDIMDEHMKGNEATNREKLSRDDKLFPWKIHSILWRLFRIILHWLGFQEERENRQENSTPSSHKTDVELSNEDVPLYDEIIQRKIHSVFEAYVIPRNVLHIFWKYDEHVLVKKDIELIESEIKNVGPTAGAGKLLELLCKYKNWIPCLIKVLCDSDVNQSHVAYKIVDILNNVQSDPSMLVSVQQLAEKDVLIARLETELDNVQSDPSMLVSVQQLAEKDVLNARLETELDEIKRELQIERDRNSAIGGEMLHLKVLAEKTNQYKDRLIQDLREQLDETKWNFRREINRNAAKDEIKRKAVHIVSGKLEGKRDKERQRNKIPDRLKEWHRAQSSTHHTKTLQTPATLSSFRRHSRHQHH